MYLINDGEFYNRKFRDSFMFAISPPASLAAIVRIDTKDTQAVYSFLFQIISQ